MDGDLAATDLHLLGGGQLGHVQQLGQHRRNHPGRTVVGLGGADHQVGRLRLDRRRQSLCGQQRVGSRQLLVRDENAAVRAHREAFANGVARPLRTHRDQDHLATLSLFEDQALFDPVFVAGVEHDFTVARDGVVRLQSLGGIGIGDLLHGYDDLHQLEIYRVNALRRGALDSRQDR